MEHEILFEEEQLMVNKSTLNFFRAMMIMFAFFLVLNLLIQVVIHHQGITIHTEGLFTGFILFLLIFLFTNRKMIVQLRSDGVYLRYFQYQSDLLFIPRQTFRNVMLENLNLCLNMKDGAIRLDP